ncbi:MAG: type VII secretion protein EssC [Mycoplasmatales bacterium]
MIALIKAEKQLFEKEFKQILNLDEFKLEPLSVLTHQVGTEITTGDLRITASNYTSSNYQGQDLIEISADDNAQIKLPNLSSKIMLDLVNKKVVVLIADKLPEIFHNKTLTTAEVFDFQVIDELVFETAVKIVFKPDNRLDITVYNQRAQINLLDISNFKVEYPAFPVYTNSPRIVKELSDQAIMLKAPPEKEKKASASELVQRLAPVIVTTIVTLGISIVQPRGPYILIAIVTTFMTIIFTVTKYFKDKKESKIFNLKRKDVYAKYMDSLQIELNQARLKEQQAYHYNRPSYDQMYNLVMNNSERLFERDQTAPDFLNIRVGISSVSPTYKLNGDINELALDKDELELEIDHLNKDFKMTPNVPINVSLEKASIGLVGKRDVIDQQIHQLLMNIYFNHSYHDVRIVIITNNLQSFFHYRWLKHLVNPVNNLTSLVYDETSRDQILSSMMQLFRARQETSEKDQKHSPNIVFIIQDYALINNHPIMEFLLKDKQKYGFSLIQIENERVHLMPNIETVIEYENKESAILQIDEKKYVNLKLTLDQATLPLASEVVTRKIGQLEHLKGISSSIPSTLSFMEMYDAQTLEELKILNRWQTNKSYKSLSVLIGKKSANEFVDLNLHEKAHGPHGLVAGTTGSGKSEVIQTYILSLAMNYSPEEVGFLLIDYKGGGMANLFKDLPHLLGTITNLDGYQSMRALASIKSELKRRQRIFSDNDVNHINGYHKLFEQGKVTEAIPHLFLISDEFAELKSEQPEFMKELVSAARIGRSLGIHLILATQKPSGVVDDQIWSNSKFKLCLKVAEEADSKELLKTADAAYIKEAGRGYLKVGNDEIYELFQSAYSGAAFESESEHVKDNRVYVISEIGQQKLINEDLSEGSDDKQKEVTELDRIVEYIEEVYETQNYQEVPKPWLEPLPNLLVSQTTNSQVNNKLNLVVPLGLVDIPDNQAQTIFSVNFLENPILGIFGTSQSGKTMTMMQILLELAKQNNSKLMKFFILDLGNGGLLQLKSLNHTADYLRVDDEDKYSKLLDLLENEIKRRRKLLEEKLVSSYEMYNEVSETPLEMIVLAMDNYEAAKDFDYRIIDRQIKVIRDGASLGITTIVSALNISNLKFNLQSIVNNRIQLYTMDKSDIIQTVGRTDMVLSEQAGRGFVKLEKPEVIQIYHPVETLIGKARIDELNELVESINAVNQAKNDAIPIMKDKVEYQLNVDGTANIGLDYKTVKPTSIEMQNILVYGPAASGKTNVVKLLIKQFSQKYHGYVIDSNQTTYAKISTLENITYFSVDKLKDLHDVIRPKLEEFEQRFEEQLQKAVIPKVEMLSDEDKFFIVINKTNCFTGFSSKDNEYITDILIKLSEFGIPIIVECDMYFSESAFGEFSKKMMYKIVMCQLDHKVNFDVPETDSIYSQYDGYIINGDELEQVKTMKDQEEN